MTRCLTLNSKSNAFLPSRKLWSINRGFPQSVVYRVERYADPVAEKIAGKGVLFYAPATGSGEGNLQLCFCIGTCDKDYSGKNCAGCKWILGDDDIRDSDDILDFYEFQLSVTVAAQLTGNKIKAHLPDKAATIPLGPCNRTIEVLQGFLVHNKSDQEENRHVNAQMHLLLSRVVDNLCDQAGCTECKFSGSATDVSKIQMARRILLENIGSPITIQELSRKVATNQCYLKNGFKQIFGITIFEYYQSQRMEHAKYLLWEKGLTVTEVSLILGYSSISHFSIAFKKHTGLKPCELLR